MISFRYCIIDGVLAFRRDPCKLLSENAWRYHDLVENRFGLLNRAEYKPGMNTGSSGKQIAVFLYRWNKMPALRLVERYTAVSRKEKGS